MPERAALRLFFALWPDADLRARIVRAATPFSGVGRGVRAENLHVTLLFLGDVEAARVSDVCAAAARVHARRFDITFDQIECWSRSRVMALTSSTSSPAASALAQALRAHVAEVVDFKRDERAYQPHVTLARDVRRGAKPQAIAPIGWAAREYVLVESNMTETGSHYTVRERWSLGDEETG